MNIVLVGAMGSGKDTVADKLISDYGLIPIRLGSYIRAHVDDMFSHIPKSKRRPMYQQYGEGMRQVFGEFFWNEVAYEQKQDYYSEHSHHVVVDARQPHDIKFWMEKGYTLLCVDANEQNRELRLRSRDGGQFNPETLKHYTEVRAQEIIEQVKDGALPGYVIDNNGIPESTDAQIVHIVQQLRKQYAMS